METVQHTTWRQRLQAYYYSAALISRSVQNWYFGPPCGRCGLHQRTPDLKSCWYDAG